MIFMNLTERKRKNKCKWDINIRRIQTTILKDDCKILNIDGDINSCLNEQKYECLNKELYSLS